MKRGTSWAACAGAILLLTGCSVTVRPAPDPPGTRYFSVATTLPHSGAPKVRHPLPRSVLSGNPCNALTSSQLITALGSVITGKRGTLPSGPKCDWGNLDTGGHLAVGYITETHQGLSGLYANRPAIFEPLAPIQGFPAVASSITGGDVCDISVGLADDFTVDVVGQLGSTKAGKVDPCKVFPQVADLVVTTLRHRVGR